MVDDTSVDETVKEVSEVVMVEVDDASVAGMAEEGSEAVEVGAASVVGWASVVNTDEAESELVEVEVVEVELSAAVDGATLSRVDE